ncbi:uncharacterized protein PADG_06501 [Paracoccidioides brasiliensis Pb18]|uniref:CUE domain-containing protein n=1 Tax=Paracoccidioides brasiliensis (strain Pb18) TaxID=502780 RepID=C1GGR4_PARBD|nr:uncharacterized protein PADG_06501 [Paracoccidioides brasiliensis Pb18]EEH50422.2 hypothetical protein PADG_06501 [Paracoccidioides brasiliensis Pb18]
MAHDPLPPLAPFPPPAVRNLIQNEEWGACLDAWITLLELRLKTPLDEVQSSTPKDDSARVFLASFFREAAVGGLSIPRGLDADVKMKSLRRLCFLLTGRHLLQVRPPTPELLDWEFLASFCQVYISSPATKQLLAQLWMQESQALTASIEKGKFLVMNALSLSSKATDSITRANNHLRLLTILALTVPQIGHVLMTGSDYIDALFDAYQSTHKINVSLNKTIVANAYVSFTSLLKVDPPATSLLLDQLFSLKSAAKMDEKGTKREPTLLSDIMCSTNLLAKMERVFAREGPKRGQHLVVLLRQYQAECSSLHSRYQRVKRRQGKGKGREKEIKPERGDQIMHVHKMALITQVQDLFPHLGTGYIAKLLGSYEDDVEIVISHLIEDSLAPQLRDLDPSEELQDYLVPHHNLAPKPTPPLLPYLSPLPSPTTLPPSTIPQRKNIFDNDELTRQTIPASKLHYGRANPNVTADTLLATSSKSVNKAAILSALAAFDSDDDERDDTYDVADVGGTVDAVPPDEDVETAPFRRTQGERDTDYILFTHYTTNQAVFAREAATRRSTPRANLRRETGMTDEAIEGWAVMLSRDPKRMARMERSFALGAGPGGRESWQPELASTAYRRPINTDSPDGTGTEGEETDGGGGHGGRGRGLWRGSGRRGGGRRGGGGDGGDGGNADVYPGGRGTAVARQRKDANKASRANHNRRNQRAKKMARGGL